MKKIFLLILLTSFTSTALTRSEPVGSYTNGTLLNGVSLPEEGTGFMHLYRESNRHWGTGEMIDLITKSAEHMDRIYPNQGRLQVEDISAQNGGDIDGHGSHENGLDVDLTYYRQDGLEHEPTVEQQYSPPMVVKGKITSNFDHQKNWEFVKALHQNGKINRIFMDNVIKKELCKYAKSINEFDSNVNVLRSIRHEENHADHMHVRINCPTYAKKCVPQAALPAGSGC